MIENDLTRVANKVTRMNKMSKSRSPRAAEGNDHPSSFGGSACLGMEVFGDC
jgi:hypothetical protein